MINRKTFLQGFHLLKENFEFDNSQEYANIIYDTLKNRLDDKMFLDTCNDILLSTTKDDWSKSYGFKGRPAIKDWLDAFIPEKIEKKRYFDCKITGARLFEIVFDYPDYYLKFLNQHKGVKLEASNRENQKKVESIIKTISSKKI
jgi:hypothetical protein